METALQLTGMGFPPFSARECRQTLTPIHGGRYVRTLQGKLCFVGPKGVVRYKSVIEGQDHTAPTFDTQMIGEKIRVGCMTRLWKLLTFDDVLDQEIFLDRACVPGTLSGCDDTHHALEIEEISASRVRIKTPAQKGRGFLTYCPQMWMTLTEFETHYDENAMLNRWRLVLEE